MSAISRFAIYAAVTFALVGCGRLIGSGGSNAIEASSKESGTMDQTKPVTPAAPPKGKEIATLAGGCFWCTEAVFRELRGVEKVEPGYAGGTEANPTYEQVCTGRTGHAESIEITFDPKVVSYTDLVRVFLTTHDPTTLNRQGADTGTQYRSAIFYHGDTQREAAHEVIAEIEKKHVWAAKIVTEVTPFANFYPAEAYHREYYERNPDQAYCRIVIEPKVAKLREKYRSMLKR